MMKKVIPLLLLILVLSGCAGQKQVYQVVYLDVFDTVTTLRGYDTSEAAFNQKAAKVHEALLEYHHLFDIYHDYPASVYEVNENAGRAPVQVAPSVMELLSDCRDYCNLTHGRVNAAMGSVLMLWHEAREAAADGNAALPDLASLQAAAEHTSFDRIVLNKQDGTVFIEDPAQRLDVGAIAKGWAAQRVSELLPEGYLLNLGGNICAMGRKADESDWVIGIQDPDDPTGYLCTVAVANNCAVTSGDYQRYFTLDGKNYHHIIDPDTLMPSEYWRSVTILCPDAGLADCLSTALFLLPFEEGNDLVKSVHAEALWIAIDGTIYQTDGFHANFSNT